MTKTVRKLIHEPMWSEKALGVAVDKKSSDSTLYHISCDYKRKSTNTLFMPGIYVMSVRQIKQYPSRTVKGIKLYLIPFNDLEEKSLKEKNHDNYQPTGTEGEDLTATDNWKAAHQLEFFKQAYLDPMHQAVQRGWEYVTTDKYEKECQIQGKTPNPDEKQRINTRYEELKYKYDQFDKTYKRMFDMVMRYENLLTEIESLNAQWMELFPNGMPNLLSPMRNSFLEHYFTKLDSYIRK